MQTCGITFETGELIRLGHGSGGKLTEQLITNIFLPRIGNPILNELDDAATFRLGESNIAFTTDSYVVKPLFFPGGDIGSLAIHGTVNDLAMKLARPVYLAVSFILEEGFPLSDLERVVDSLSASAKESCVEIVTADTKVVNRGAGDGVFINTTALGIIESSSPPSSKSARSGDVIIASGDVGSHGIAILCAREQLDLEADLVSDSACLTEVVMQLSRFGSDLHCLRDLTRGGLSSALNEIATASSVGIEISDVSIPISSPVRGACELLGLDPLYVACEGRFVSIVERSKADEALAVLRSHPLGHNASIIGHVVDEHRGRVVARTAVGGRRVVDRLSGDQLPRIC